MPGLIPQSFLDDLLQRTDLVELIDSYIPLQKKGSSYVACCPFHNEKSPSFNVVAKKQFYHCFGCGVSGNAISFTINYLNQGFVDAVETLATRLGLTIPREGQDDTHHISRDLYKLLSSVNEYYQKQLKYQGQSAIDYLRQRGLNGSIAKQYQIGFSQEGWHHLEKQFPLNQRELLISGMLIKNEQGQIYDRYRNRVMFPIHDRHGRIIGFGGRVLDDTQKPKYLNSPETVIFQKNRELYGLHQILQQKKPIESIIIVEGYLDVIGLAQHQISNAVATLGTATSNYHIQLLAKHTKNIIFCFDGDNAGLQAAWRGLESSLGSLHEGLEVKFMFLPKTHDPDSLIRSEGTESFLQRIQEAKPLAVFFLETLVKQVDIATPGGKTQLINLTKPFFKKMSEGTYKQLLIDNLARLTHIDNHRLNALVTQDSTINTDLTNLTRSPMRIACALLLQHPEIYYAIKSQISVNLLHTDQHAVLIKIIQHLQENPNANTATLIEAWRHHELFNFINKLAAWEHQVPEQDLVNEFLDTFLFLQKQNQESHIRKLIEKSRQHGLTTDERLELQSMLKKRHV